MTKSELIKTVSYKSPKIAAKDVEHVINATIATIKDEVTAGGEVNLIGFGKFHVRDRAARRGHNPRTGEDIQIAAHKSPWFTLGQSFKKAVQS